MKNIAFTQKIFVLIHLVHFIIEYKTTYYYVLDIVLLCLAA